MKNEVFQPPNIESQYRLSNCPSSLLKLKNAEIVQCGLTYFSSTTKIPPHNHLNYYELTIITEGEGVILINNEPVNVKKNDICLTMPYEKHEIVSSKSKLLHIQNIAFSVSKASSIQKFNSFFQTFRSLNERVFASRTVSFLVESLLEEILTDESMNEDLIAALLDALILYVIEIFVNRKNSKKLSVTKQQVFCYQVMNYIKTNIPTLQSLQELSGPFHYSYPYISTIFKKTTNTLLRDFYTDAKLEYAVTLLEDKTHTIKEIAEMLNYSSDNAFTKAFRTKYGVSPSKYTK